MKNKKTCFSCEFSSIVRKNGEKVCICYFDVESDYIAEPEKKAKKCPNYEQAEVMR